MRWRQRAIEDLLRQAEDIRALVGRMRQAIAVGELAVDAATLANWEQWALGKADLVDPVR